MTRARVVAAGFVIGGAFHLRDIVAGGWMPYRFAPDAMNLFWTMLLPLDLIAAGLILWRPGRRMGVVLGLAIMAADLGVNGHAWGQMGIAAFGPALTIQGAFALLLAAWAPSLWHSASTSPISRA